MLGHMKRQHQAKKKKIYVDEDRIEAKRNIPSSVASSFADDLIKPAVTKDLWEQLLGVGRKPQEQKIQASGDIAEGEGIDIKALERQISRTEKKIEQLEPALDYHREIRYSSERVMKENEVVLTRRIQEIQIELKNLAHSSKTLQQTFKEVVVESTPVEPGTYHINFFEWVLSVIHSARLRVEESQTWLSLFASKKAKKGYWSMFKKHGTSFGLSGERVVATQTG